MAPYKFSAARQVDAESELFMTVEDAKEKIELANKEQPKDNDEEKLNTNDKRTSTMIRFLLIQGLLVTRALRFK